MERQRNPIDLHVGQRLKLRRTMTSVTQDKLAQAVGVTFQMIQKYEKGDCRVGASRLMQISRALGVPVSWFFEGFAGTSSTPMLQVAEDRQILDDEMFHRKETIDLLKAYYALPESVRKHVLGMVKGLEKEDQPASSPQKGAA